MPQRLQLSRRKGYRLPPDAVNVARPGPWGNPFKAIDPDNPEHVKAAVKYFREWLTGSSNAFSCGPEHGVTLTYIPAWNVPGNLRAKLPDLRGKALACWCPPGSPCHADVLLELANITIP